MNTLMCVLMIKNSKENRLEYRWTVPVILAKKRPGNEQIGRRAC